MFPYQNMQNMTEERNNMIASTKQAKPYKNLSIIKLDFQRPKMRKLSAKCKNKYKNNSIF